MSYNLRKMGQTPHNHTENKGNHTTAPAGAGAGSTGNSRIRETRLRPSSPSEPGRARTPRRAGGARAGGQGPAWDSGAGDSPERPRREERVPGCPTRPGGLTTRTRGPAAPRPRSGSRRREPPAKFAGGRHLPAAPRTRWARRSQHPRGALGPLRPGRGTAGAAPPPTAGSSPHATAATSPPCGRGDREPPLLGGVRPPSHAQAGTGPAGRGAAAGQCRGLSPSELRGLSDRPARDARPEPLAERLRGVKSVFCKPDLKSVLLGRLGGSVGEAPTSARGTVLGSWGPGIQQGPCSAHLLESLWCLSLSPELEASEGRGGLCESHRATGAVWAGGLRDLTQREGRCAGDQGAPAIPRRAP